ncbi:hypothetical protein AX15_007772 [Amanita polypyramis BW_CC]|nr:hypothetical protein AX15_007772 [Amanita polypyramis BW_CC]
MASTSINQPLHSSYFKCDANKISAYSLSSACLLLLFGRIADLYGRKKTFLAGSTWLFAFTLACGFAQNELTLEILRGLQGAGVAATIPASLGILANAFPISSGRMRSIAFAVFAAGAPVGAFIGSCLGALLTQLTVKTWRSNFYLSAGLTGFYVLIGFLVIDKDLPSTETDRRIDWLGGFLITAGLVLIIFVLSDGEVAPNKWATPYIIACIILGCFFVGLFLLWQWYLERVQNNPNAQYSKWTPPPLMKVSLWTRGNWRFSAIMVIALLTWCSFLGWQFWTTIYYQNYLLLTPIATMLRFIPMFITGVLLNYVVVLTIHRVSVIWLLVAGTFVTGCAPIFLAAISPSASFWATGFPSSICSVFGADFVFASGTLYVARVVKQNEQSLSGALFQTMTQIGTAIGVIVSTIVFNRVIVRESDRLGVVINEEQDNIPRIAQLKAYRAAEWTSFAFGMIATIFVLLFFRGVGIIGVKNKTPPNPVNDVKSSNSSSTTVAQPIKLETKSLPSQAQSETSSSSASPTIPPFSPATPGPELDNEKGELASRTPSTLV